MGKIKKAWNFIFRKDSLLFLTGIFAIIIFRTPFESLLNSTVVEHLFSQVKSEWWNDLILGVIILGAIIFSFRMSRDYVPSFKFVGFYFIISCIYLFYRFEGATWGFTTFYSCTKINYADILIIFSICQLGLLAFPKKEKEKRENGENSFYQDNPLGANGIDNLGYSSYASVVGGKILESYFKNSFAIGVNGKWGSGKTSFIDLLKRKIQGDDVIEISFNPWNSQSPDAINKDFFETIQEVIQPYHSSLSKLFIQYSDKLLTLNDNSVTQSIQTTISAIADVESVNSLHEAINERLESLGKKIVIYVDDLDRLDKNEIIAVLRLIRNTANFHNTFFIVAYDRNYVINAIRQQNSFTPEDFLEKIFQIEITLPLFKKDQLRFELAEKLKLRFPKRIHSTIEEEIIGTSTTTPVFLNNWLDNLRDVTRLANGLILNYTNLIDEVDFGEFLRIELLRLKYPSVHELLHKKTHSFLEAVSNTQSNENHYHIIREQSDQKSKESFIDIKQPISVLESYLSENHDKLSCPKDEIHKVVEFIEGIFGGGVIYFVFDKRSHVSIVKPSKFNRYFAYTLFEDSLSEVEFSRARLLSQEEFNHQISDWVINGLEVELKNRFAAIRAYDNREDFEKITKAIFYLANLPSQKTYSFNRPVGFEGIFLLNNLSVNNHLVQNLYGKNKDENLLKGFVRSLFEEAKGPYFFESELIRFINDRFGDSFLLTKEELNDIAIDYLRKYCSSIDKEDYVIWRLFHNCKFTDSLGPEIEPYPLEAKKILKDFILNKDLDGVILSIINTELFDQNQFSISQVIKTIFTDWNEFEKELNLKNELDFEYLSEFKVFLSEFALKNYSSSVEFEFKKIPILDKVNK